MFDPLTGEEARRESASLIGCCYDCGRALDDARKLDEQCLICAHCGELVLPREALRGRCARLRRALYPTHRNTQDRSGVGTGFQVSPPALWAHAAAAIFAAGGNILRAADPSAPSDAHYILAESTPTHRPPGRQRYWSHELGWAGIAIASVYDASEYSRLCETLPIDGEWCELPSLA